MRIGNLDGRLVLQIEERVVDVAAASDGRFAPDPQAIYPRWDEFVEWARTAHGEPISLDPLLLGPPVPRPPQIFAIGFNYTDHAEEASTDIPKHPMVFTKFASCLTGPNAEVTIGPRMLVDWEVELVVVISRKVSNVAIDHAWDYVAGLTIGQDLSDRRLQMRPPTPQQFAMGKSRKGFGPIGPFVVTLDELTTPGDLAIECSIDNEILQSSRTSAMLFTVPDLISRLSRVVTLLPGDLIFTGTPGGIGATREPQRWIQPGEILKSRIEGLGQMTTRFSEIN